MDFNKRYKDFIANLYQRHSGNVKYGLERMIGLLDELNSPHAKLKGIHVAGTNGKGSTCAISESIIKTAGYTCGLNTSPHLVDYRERLRINGKNIDQDTLENNYNKWHDIFEKYEASFFEMTTAMAFSLFYELNLDTSIFEVGLGGRLDGTNPFKSTVSVITTVSLDHPKSLGDTVEKIAFEKAGIIKQNTPVVVGEINGKPLQVVLNKARQMNAPVYKLGKDFEISNVSLNEQGTNFDYKGLGLDIKNLSVNLLGKHQANNAACAITAVKLYFDILGRELTEELLKKALKNVNWQGRMQILQQNPTVIIDGAHNEEGMDLLISNLKSIFKGKSFKTVIAILRDKKLDKMIKDIGRISSKMYISKNRSNRAAELEEQTLAAQRVGADYSTFEDVLSAYKQALTEAKADDIIVITGSLYTISEVLAAK